MGAELEALPVPGRDAPTTAWQRFTQNLRALVVQHGDISHERHLSGEQIERLTDYFKANQLLVDCLQVAYVSDREAVLDRVLRVD